VPGVERGDGREESGYTGGSRMEGAPVGVSAEPPHTQGTDAGVATSDRESGGPVLCVRGDPERGTPYGGGVRGGEETEVGRDQDGCGVLRGGDGVSTGARERLKGGGGRGG